MSNLRKFFIAATAASIAFASQAHASVGYADVVLDYFDSGAGPMAGPYGGTYPTGPGFPIPVSTDVVLGHEPGPTGFPDSLSLPTGSYVTVGFTDETVIDGAGNDIFIEEIGPSGERATVYISSDLSNFVELGIAVAGGTTGFDLASIGFLNPVRAVKIVGMDNFGGSPGFDVANIQVLPGSIGPVPEPESAGMLLVGLGLLAAAIRRRK
jgi:hypothetical protein